LRLSLILTACNPELPLVSKEIAEEITGLFIDTIMDKKEDAALEFINSLKREQKHRLYDLLRLGGVDEKAEFVSNNSWVTMSELGA